MISTVTCAARPGRSGESSAYFENGLKRIVTHNRNGVENGKFERWHQNGRKAAEGSHRNGKRAGTWTFWNDDGSKDEAKSGPYRDGKLGLPHEQTCDDGMQEEQHTTESEHC